MYGRDDTHRGLQPKGNEVNDKALLLMPVTMPVDRQNNQNKKKSQPTRPKQSN